VISSCAYWRELAKRAEDERDQLAAELARLIVAKLPTADDYDRIVKERDQLAAELARVRPVIAGFCETVSAARRNMERAPGGQHVSFHGDFCNTNPSTMSRLVRWAREMEKALSPAPKTGGDK
jgi:CTP:molybdopterin cytidylyltransferase MocA